MSRTIKWLATCALAAAGVAGLVFLSACSTTSSSSTTGFGRLNVLVTDGPTDDWQQVNVQLNSISLRKSEDQSWVPVWTPSGGATTLNLVHLADVATILGTATIDVGTYDRMKIVINPDPTTMTFVAGDGTTYSGADGTITVVDPSGKGEIKADIKPALTILADSTNILTVDFDLAHPLSIFVLNGKAVLNLQVRYRAVPRSLRDIQFARTIGNVTDADTTNKSSFSLTPLDATTALTFTVDGSTAYVDVDANAAGTFDGLAALKGSTDKGALVASNMWSDGTLYARQVWYGTITSLPSFTPEGLVRRVGDNWISVLNKNAQPAANSRYSCKWDSDIIYVNDATAWTFHDTISMGTGTSILQYIRRGFRVSVVYVDATAIPKFAASINVQSAHDEGSIRSVSTTAPGAITFGGGDYCQGWAPGLPHASWMGYSHTWPCSTVDGHTFSWWPYGLPSSQASTSVSDLSAAVVAAQQVNMRVFARVDLYWDTTANNNTGGWVVENCVLTPGKLREPTKITTDYSNGTMGVSTFDWDDDSLPVTLTVNLDSNGDLQTVVALVTWNSITRVLTTVVPVPSTNWATVLTGANTFGVKLWVWPETGTSGVTWHAYSVIAFKIITQ